MDKLNYKIAHGVMPEGLDPNDFVRVVMLDGYTEYDMARFIDWDEVEMYATVGEE